MGSAETDAKLDRLVDALLTSASVVGAAPGGGIDVAALAAAIVAAQDAAAKAPGRNILDEQMLQLQQMRDRPGGKLGYSHNVTSKSPVRRSPSRCRSHENPSSGESLDS